MNYGSVCSGVEAATLAWERLGWQAKFFAEVEPFPAAVLYHRFGATRPLRPLDPAGADNEKDRKLREAWSRQIAELPQGGTIPNLGDFTQIKGDDYDGNIDILVGGCPCQSYSLAGLRKGLGDPRGNLSLEFVKLAYRSGARVLVYENVPGILSSGDKGSDFAGFLSLLCGWEVTVPKDGWRKCGIVTSAPGCFGVAWRILDAQYTRVSEFPRAIPQRRRRLILVGHLNSWLYPAKILFDEEMRGGNTPPRRTTRQGITSDLESCIDTTKPNRVRGKYNNSVKDVLAGDSLSREQPNVSWWNGDNKTRTPNYSSDNRQIQDKQRLKCVIDMRQTEAKTENVSPTLISTDYKGGKAVCFENHGNDSRIKEVDASPTITSRAGTGGNNLPFVQEHLAFIKNDAGGEQEGYWKDVFPTLRSQIIPAVAEKECFNVSFCDANGTRKDRKNGGLYVTEAESSKTITTNGGAAETVIVHDVIALDGDKMAKAEREGGSGLGISEENVMYTQTAKDVHAIAYNELILSDIQNVTDHCENQALTNGQESDGDNATVRRLLPVECERLMGFQDNHTRIPWKGKHEEDCPDAPRYKACGNSMCVNVMLWIGHRINELEKTISHKK